ncbi:MAG: NUDIX hydrolase [Candidatus Dojkabacteria bacterium]|nr:MAG: NUDIX hydrolase [Candidatus Dojkabacteria bacterium]
MKDLHEIQRKILMKLLFAKDLRYSDMKPDERMENSQFDFHLDTLIGQGFISKENDKYALTTKGKEFANRHDSDTTKLKVQAKISVWIAAYRDHEDKREYLIYTRLKNPFYGAQGFIAGKLDYGEKVLDGTKRELLEEANLKGEPELVHIRHYINKNKETNEVIEDKFFFLCVVKNPTGEIVSSNEGLYEWVSKEQFKEKVTNHFENFDSFLRDIDIIEQFDGQITFDERVEYPEKF